jgi:hypothetical protein
MTYAHVIKGIYSVELFTGEKLRRHRKDSQGY